MSEIDRASRAGFILLCISLIVIVALYFRSCLVKDELSQATRAPSETPGQWHIDNIAVVSERGNLAILREQFDVDDADFSSSIQFGHWRHSTATVSASTPILGKFSTETGRVSGPHGIAGWFWTRDFPIWFLSLPVVAPILILVLPGIRRRQVLKFRRRRHVTRCDECGYDLKGNLSGVCPECGTRFK
jgi:hypothetical protein